MKYSPTRQIGGNGHSNQLILTAAFAGPSVFFVYCWGSSSGSEFSDTFLENAILLCMCIYGTWVLALEYRRSQLLSPLALFFLTMMGHFGVTGLMYPYTSFFVNRGNAEYIIGTLVYLVVFMMMFHLGYRLFVPVSPKNQIPSPTVTKSYWRTDRAILAAVALLVVGYFIRIYVIQLGIYLHTSLGTDEGARRVSFIGLIRNLEFWPGYGALILMILSYRARFVQTANARLIGAAAIATNILNVLYWIPTGAKYNIITAVIGPFAVHYLYTKRLPSRSVMAAGVVFIIALFPLTYMYRVAQTKFVGSMNITSIEGVTAVISDALADLTTVKQVGANNRVLGRLNQIEPVAAAIRIIDDGVIQMKWGMDYFNVITNMIPRFVWPGKPDVFYGNRFGHLAGMVSLQDQYTSISVTLPAEAYLNFYIFGVLVGALLAAIFSFVYLLCTRLRCYETWVLLYVATIPTILYVGASFALYISSWFQTLAVLAIATTFIGTSTRMDRSSSLKRRARKLVRSQFRPSLRRY